MIFTRWEHADAKMTKHYQDGHVEKGIEYLEVGADLAFLGGGFAKPSA